MYAVCEYAHFLATLMHVSRKSTSDFMTLALLPIVKVPFRNPSAISRMRILLYARSLSS